MALVFIDTRFILLFMVEGIPHKCIGEVASPCQFPSVFRITVVGFF